MPQLDETTPSVEEAALLVERSSLGSCFVPERCSRSGATVN
jgi:hypothetical protein